MINFFIIFLVISVAIPDEIQLPSAVFLHSVDDAITDKIFQICDRKIRKKNRWQHVFVAFVDDLKKNHSLSVAAELNANLVKN